MADMTMHHVVIGSDTYEIVDSVARVEAEAAFATDTASGAIATFSDGADGVPVKALSVDIEPVQSGSGDPSPTNVRAISGWDAVHVYVDETVGTHDATYTIALPQTVYGGTLDVASGVVTIDKGYRTLTSSLNWSKFSSGSIFYVTVADKAFGGANVISEKFVTNANRTNLSVSGSATTHAVYFRDDSCADIAAFLAAYPTLNIVCELETPQTVQLSPTEVTTLLGENNIYADSGSVAVTYRADTGLYIDKRLNA